MAKKAARKAAKKAAPKSRKSPAKKPASKIVTKSASAKSSSGKWVYRFGDGKAEGKSSMRDLLGGKGANLAEMANLGLPVPPGFTITTEVCTWFYDHDRHYPDELAQHLSKLIRGPMLWWFDCGWRYGSPRRQRT